MTIKKISLLILFTMLISACNKSSEPNASAQNAADTLLVNGKIYTVDASQPWVEAVAIKDGKYQYVGDMNGVKQYRGKQTQVIDLQGKMAMPGINDAHVHPEMGGLKMLYECVFPFTAGPDEIALTLEKCVKENPDAEWIIGGQWDSDLFVNHNLASPKALLDSVSGNKAVMLSSDSGHDGWVNSKALQLAGINKNTEPVEGGVIGRDPHTGEPNGLLLEHAKELVGKLIPDWTLTQYKAATVYAMETANQYGITGFKDAWTKEGALTAFKALSDTNQITLHLAAAIDVKYGLDQDESFDVSKLETLRDNYDTSQVDTRFVKIFMDGVPTSSRTAAMLANYLPTKDGHSHSGGLHFNPEKLAEMITELDKAGFTVKIHTAGDRSVRVTLDAIEQARIRNGDSGLRHELAHAGYIDETDLPRFAALNAVADLSPYLWHPSPIIDSVLGAVGERGEHYWPIKDLLASGAPVAAGSDWPAAVPTMDPWVGIEAMVTRADPRGQFPGTFWPEQAITLAQALEIYTMGGARALRLENQTGSVMLGKSADLTVLNQNLFDIPVEKISDTQVEMTFFTGKMVFQRPQQH
ncbi:MAG: amidohydrolase [Pseudomonadales bacterium]|nr:amidohydrolase [Pseudomonadales bacterium]